MKISVVIPTYNEAATIAELINRVNCVDIPKEIIVVDDGSSDGTLQQLQTLEMQYDNLRFLVQPRNQGKGAALRLGFQQATGDYVLVQDADLEYDPADYPVLLKPLVTVDLPVLRFEKTVTNVTSGQSPATHATPGDTLRYRIRIENLVSAPVPNFTLRDELGRLNNAAVYAPGTLNVVTVPAGGDATNTNPSGGVNNAGLVDIRNLSLGGLGTFIVVEYDVRTAPALPNQSYVLNQAQVYVSGFEVARSDDPNVGAAPPNPLVLGDEDPTRVQITSAPRFRVLKTSTYLGASTTILRAGDRLRYTITIKNVGTANATGVSIRDQIPANTSCVLPPL